MADIISTPKGYILKSNKTIIETGSELFRFEHKKTGAEIFWLKNDDNNKVFIIGFRTPANDNTGAAHIIEHSVLCGSKNYPCKEPFVELIKSSLNTFLNAMTYPDKTVYPVASTNNTDFKNLMRVYLDAVFYPMIYQNDKILKQEGWHYHIEKPEDPLTYKGVVYNEMKGVFSSPESLLLREVNHVLFPENQYKYESGGDPNSIFLLTDTKFRNFHKKYYHPSNSMVFLYGNIDHNEIFDIMDNEYLSNFTKTNPVSVYKHQNPFDKPIYLKKKYPVSDNSSNRKKSYHSLNFVIGNCVNLEEVIAFDILEEVLVNSSISILRQKLLDENLCNDVFANFEIDMKQTVFSIVAKECALSSKERFEKIVLDTFTDIANNGLDKELVIGEYSRKLFKLRESDFKSLPKGIVYGLNIISQWGYGDDPVPVLEFEKPMKNIRRLINEGYLEKLIIEKLINNKHRASVTLKPEKGLDIKLNKKEADKLNKIKSKLTGKEIDALVKETNNLLNYQKLPDSPDSLLTIPKLSLNDINKNSFFPKYETEIINKNTRIIIPQQTNGIFYFDMFFDIRVLSEKEIQHLSLFTELIGELSTKKYSYEELNNRINGDLGDLDFSCENFRNLKTGEHQPKLSVKAKFLRENNDKYIDLILEILTKTDFSNKQRIKELIQEVRSVVEQSILQKGNAYCSMRLVSALRPYKTIDELQHGIEFYKYICDIETNFNQRFDELKITMERIKNSLFINENVDFAYSSDPLYLTECKKTASAISERLPESSLIRNNLIIKNNFINEGFVIPSSVNYIAAGLDLDNTITQFRGSMFVLRKIIGYDYLWNRVRVQGGAYGANISISRTGVIIMSSYRDPNVKETIDAYKDIPKYLKEFAADDKEVANYIIGAISNLDIPLTPSMTISKSVISYFKGINEDDLNNERQDVLSTTADQIRGYAEIFDVINKKMIICGIGGEKISENNGLFTKIDRIF